MAAVGSVDVELELITRATARFPGAVVRDELDNRLLEELPTIQIAVVPGGGDDGLRVGRALVDIDVYHSTRGEAIALAAQVREWVLTELRGSTSATAVIARTGTVTPPAVRPYDNTALRRVGATYEIYSRPVD